MLQKINIKKLIIINIILLICLKYLPSNKVDIKTNDEIITNAIIEDKQEITSRSLEESRHEDKIEITQTNIIKDNTLEGYQVTSYHPGDNCLTSKTTGSGKTTDDFNIINIDGKNVYTYQGRIVVAGATNSLLNSGYNKNGSQEKQTKHYFNYYDTGRIKLNDNWYGFIVLDSCGAAMWKGYYRLDIFVPSSNDIIDAKNIEIVYD